MTIGIVGTGSYLPPTVLTNHEVAARANATEEWILEKTGIQERRIASPEEAASDLAVAASRRALDSCGVSPSEVGLIVVATSTGDQPIPSTACQVQAALSADNAIPLDISAACAGFLYALRIGCDLLSATPSMRYALVVGTEVLSRFVDYEDKKTCILFGDGAGAVVLAKVGSGGIMNSILGADGRRVIGLGGIPGGGSRMPASSATLANRSHYLKMHDGREIREFVSETVSRLVSLILEAEGLEIRDLDLFVPHQANGRMIDGWKDLLKLNKDQVYGNVAKVGNTSAASIPIALDHATRDLRLKFGDIVLLLAFGGGGTWGATLLRWSIRRPVDEVDT